LRIAAVLLFAALAGPPPNTVASSAAAPTKPAPNLLIIVTDDQRATETLQVMQETVRIFSGGGVTFPRAFATTPLCCPSRATLFSGRYAHNHGVMTNSEGADLQHEYTVQAYLQAAGYHTGIAGKYLNRWDLEQDPPYFERWAICSSCGYYDSPFNVNGETRTVPGYSTDFIAGRAIRFLRRFETSDVDPWLLFVTPYAPHGPSTREPAYEDAPVGKWSGNPAVRERDRSDKPPFVRDRHAGLTRGRLIRRAQLRTLMSVDDLVQRIFRALSELGERRRTLAIFVSDDGYLWAEHGVTGKNVPYTQSIEIPLMMRWPGHVPSGTVDRRIVANVDVPATLLHAAGVVPPLGAPALDGRSILDSSWTRRRILTESGGTVRLIESGGTVRLVPNWASIRSAAYQYVEYYADDGTTVEFREYYDLREDPWQLVNLLGDGDPTNDPDVPTLHARLAADRACAGSSCP
jgi:arylsulfatase A-like enzyme